MAAKKKRVKPGPKPDRIKIEGDWKEALRKAIDATKPEAGWPKLTNQQTPKANRVVNQRRAKKPRASRGEPGS